MPSKQQEVIDIYRIEHLTRAEYIFIASIHKTKVNNFKRIEVIQKVFTDLNGIKGKITKQKNLQRTGN